jgi:hypothetical protein
MVYFIELSVCLKQSVNLHTIKDSLLLKARECRYIDFYDNFNIEGRNRTIIKNQCILTFIFEEHDELFADFIKYAKTKYKTSIDLVAIDGPKFEMIYASHSYLNGMDKFLAKKFIEKKKNKLLPKQDSIIFTVLRKKYK